MVETQTIQDMRNQISWFPPAESRIPAYQLLRSLFPVRKKLSEELVPLIGICAFRLAVNGRCLLYCLLKALKERDGNRRTEVLVPGYTCYSVAAAVAKAGLTIGVYDLDPHSFNPDPDSLRRAATENTLAILSQHLFGIPTALDAVVKIAAESGAIHIEDAAQALGGYYENRPLGMTGDYGLFSFGRGKPLPLGCGGMLTAPKDKLLRSIDLLPETNNAKLLASNLAAQIFSQPLLYGIAEALPLQLGQTHFDPGFEIKGMSKISRRLLTISLPGLEKLNNHRRNIAKIYRQELVPELAYDEPDTGICVYTRFPLRTPENKIPALLKKRGIRRMYPKALIDELKIKAHISKESEDTPGARQIAATLLTAPTHLGVKRGDALLTTGLINDLLNVHSRPYAKNR